MIKTFHKNILHINRIGRELTLVALSGMLIAMSILMVFVMVVSKYT